MVSGVFCRSGSSSEDLGEHEEDMAADPDEAEPGLQQRLCADALSGLARCLAEHSLSDQPEMQRRCGGRVAPCKYDSTRLCASQLFQMLQLQLMLFRSAAILQALQLQRQ